MTLSSMNVLQILYYNHYKFSVAGLYCCLLLQVLLGAEADVDHADVDGWTALRAAAWGGHTQVWGYKQVTTIQSAP